MANEFYDEHEQGEAVKKFLKQYGSSLLVGVALGLGGLFGYQQYQAYLLKQRAEAALQFEVLQQARSGGDSAFVIEVAERMRRDYARSPYAAFASMAEADVRIGREEYAEAERALRWAAERGRPDELRSIAGLRLARVLIASGQPEQALRTLERLPRAGLEAQIDETRGDALLVLGRLDEARVAYEDALARMPVGAQQRSVLELKFNDLAVPGEAG